MVVTATEKQFAKAGSERVTDVQVTAATMTWCPCTAQFIANVSRCEKWEKCALQWVGASGERTREQPQGCGAGDKGDPRPRHPPERETDQQHLSGLKRG